MSRDRARAASLPVKPNPVGRKTPSRIPASSRDSAAGRGSDRGSRGRRAAPFSSFVHSTTRTVRRGRRFSFFIRRSASHVTTHPPPSSVDPVPTSHESKWPPMTTTSSGSSRPRSSPTTLAESASGRKCASISSCRRDGRAAVLHALQPVGILGRHRGGRNLRLRRRRSAARRCAACAGRRDRPRGPAPRPRRAPRRATGRPRGTGPVSP